MRFTVYKKTVFFSFIFFLISTTLCFGSTVSDIADNYYDDASQYVKNEMSNKGVFNPVEFASFKGYKGDGSFVEGPARVGDWFGYIIGVIPAIALSEPFRLFNILSDEGNGIGEYTLYGTTKTFGCLFGGPSFILKGIFWDAPVWVYSSIFGSKPASKPSAEHEIKPKPIVHEKAEEELPSSADKWQPKEIKPPAITSISAKPAMLIAEETPSEKEELAIKEKSVTQTPKTSVTTKRFVDPEKDKITKDDETSWSSSPDLPDWVKKEMGKE